MIRRVPILVPLCWLSLGCAGTYHKAYEGPELSAEELSFVHGASAPEGFFSSLSTSLINPQTKKTIPSGGSLDQGKQWLAVKPPTTCITVRTVAFNCVVSLGTQCVPNAHTQRDQEICFKVAPGAKYEIQTYARGNRDCYAGLELTGYRVLELETGEAVHDAEVSKHCWSYVGHRISEWARHFSWRDGNWIQRSMWSSVNKEMLKRWSRSPDYRAWWTENGQAFDIEFADYVASVAAGIEE